MGVVTASGASDLTGVGYAPTGQVEHASGPLQPGALHEENVAVLSGGSLAGNAALRQNTGGDWEILGDPTEAAFLASEHKLGSAARRERRFTRIGEIPFTYRARRAGPTWSGGVCRSGTPHVGLRARRTAPQAVHRACTAGWLVQRASQGGSTGVWSRRGECAVKVR